MNSLTTFLTTYCDHQKPVLLGFSGGPDSLALLHALLDYSKNVPLRIGLAHIDHGWRAESAQEALQLKAMAQELGVPFHTKRLSPDEIKGNLEAGCRQERLNFFAELCQEQGYQAVLLAHHADDQAETVLKRILEGSSLPYLSGLRPVTTMGILTIWRPFLSVTKAEINQWLQERSLKGIHDSTNLDPKYLRGRFRTNIIPELSEQFGKEVSPTLTRLGFEAADLRLYMEGQIKRYLDTILRNPLGMLLDLSKECPQSLFELKYLIRRFCEEGNLTPAFDIVNRAAQFIISGAADCRLMMKHHEIHIDRKRLFLLSHTGVAKFRQTDYSIPIGAHQVGPWYLEVLPAPQKGEMLNWKGLWEDGIISYLPEGNYRLGPAQNVAYPRSSPLYKWWTDHKVPAFLRHLVPVVWKENKVCHEFLTGLSKDELSARWLRVRIKLKLAVEGE